jgi:glycosyltransferase involved in cell wall biosynthesis
MRPTVVILVFTEVVRDPRVMRHVAALRDVYDLVTCGKGPAPAGVIRHVEIPAEAEHLPMTPLGLASLAARRSEAAYRRLPAASAARELLRDVPFDLIIANDITTLPVALEAANGRPVIADLHEYAPREMEEDWRWRLMVQPLAEHICREYLPRAAATTTVAEGIAEEYQARYGLLPGVVTNAGPYRHPEPRPTGAPLRAVHTGMASPNRRLETMVQAAADIQGLTFDLYLIPSPRARGYVASLRELAAATRNVRVLDPVPPDEVPTTLDGYDIGIFVLPPVNFNYRWALPNKIFDFIQSGLGIVVGPSPEMAAIVREYECGLVLSDFSAESLRRALVDLRPAQVDGWKRATCRAAAVLNDQAQAEVLRSVVARSLTGPGGHPPRS